MTPRQIKSLRNSFGDTQTEFYDRLGLDHEAPVKSKRQFIRRLEIGEREPSKSTTVLLAILKHNRGIS